MAGFSRRGFLAATGAAAAFFPRRASARDGVIPLDMTAPRPTAQLRLGETDPVTAIFDTGAAASVLMMSYAERVGLRNQGDASAAGPGGKAIRGFQTSIEGRLGDAAFGPTLGVALDVPLSLPGVSAIISPRVFAGRLVRFDFGKGEARVLSMTPANLPRVAAHPYSGVDTADAISSVPAVAGLFPGGRSGVVMVDTGWDRGLGLPYTLAEKLPLDGPLKEGRPMRRIGIEHKTWTARLKGTVKLGAVTLTDPEVIFLGDTEEMVIGMDILRNTVLTLDPAGRRAWLNSV